MSDLCISRQDNAVQLCFGDKAFRRFFWECTSMLKWHSQALKMVPFSFQKDLMTFHLKQWTGTLDIA